MTKRSTLKTVLLIVGGLGILLCICLVVFGWWLNKSFKVSPEDIYTSYISSPPVSVLQKLEGKNSHFREGPLLIKFVSDQPIVLQAQEKYTKLEFTDCRNTINSRFSANIQATTGACEYYKEVDGKILKSERWLVREEETKYIFAIVDF